MSWLTIFKVFIKIQMFYLNSKEYISIKNNVTWQIFLINSCHLSPSKQIMQMLKLQPFIFPCYAVMPHRFIALVFPLSNIVSIGIQTLDRITDHANKFYKENSMTITIHWLLKISQGHFKYVTQILILPQIWRNKEYYAVHLLVANYCFRS